MQEKFLKELRGMMFSGQDLGSVTAAKYKDLKDKVAAQMKPVPLPEVVFDKFVKLHRSRALISSLVGSHPEYLLNEFSGSADEKPFDSLAAAFEHGGRGKDKIAVYIKYLRDRADAQENKDTKDRLFETVREFAQWCEAFLLKEGFEPLYPMLGRSWAPAVEKIAADVNKASGINIVSYRDLAEQCYDMLQSIYDEQKFQRILALINLRCKGLALTIPSVSMTVVCPKCGDKEQTGTICTKCKAWVKCPGCGHPITKDAKICGGCGVEIDGIGALLDKVEQANRVLTSGDYSTAEKLIEPVKIKWAKNEGIAEAVAKIAALRAKEAEVAINKTRQKNLLIGNLACTVSGKQVQLKWDKVSCDGVEIKYIVSRKNVTNGKPQAEIGQTPVGIYNDTIESGVSYFYFVRVQWDIAGTDVSGMWDEVRSKEILSPCEVSDYRITAGDGRVNIEFAPHPYASDYELRRSDASGRTEMLKANLRGGKFTDTGLRNGVRYTYTLISIFRKSSGEAVRTAGVVMYATPMIPPQAVKELEFTTAGRTVTFSWDAKDKQSDNFRILHTVRPIDKPMGIAISLHELEKMGKLFTPFAGGKAQCDIPGHSVKNFFSVWSVGGDIAVAGVQVEVINVTEVSGIEAYISSGNLYVEWEWPAGCKQVRVSYSGKSHGDAHKTIKNCTREQYDEKKAFVIYNVQQQDYYIEVATMSFEDGGQITSAGVRLKVDNGRPMTIEYKLKVSSLLGKKLTLKVENDTGTPLPELVLMSAQGRLPALKDDGVFVYKIPAGTPCGSFRLDNKNIRKGSYGRLFVNDTEAKNIKIVTPDKEQLKLF